MLATTCTENQNTMYATKRRRRTVKSVKPPMKDPPKSNPSKRHRERLNSELDHLASLLPFEQSVISKLDKLSILRLSVSYLRTKSYFQSVLHKSYQYDPHLNGHHHLYPEPDFSEGDGTLQALNGFLCVVSCDTEVFFASRTVEQYLGFHQSDIIHQSVLELIHSEDRDEFKKQLTWNSQLPADKTGMALQEALLPENSHILHRSFTVRFRCLLDNTSGFITLEISGWLKLLHGQSTKGEDPPLALFAVCCPFGPLPLLDVPARDYTFKTKHKMDMTPTAMDQRGKALFGYTDSNLNTIGGYDLIHPDDLKYYSEAHQELMKTGNSGLIAYRLMTKDYKWLWLQSSCKIVYKNSKPDFVLTTHRHLTDDEGKELFGKRGSEFKLPYPIIDLEYPNGFEVEYEEEMSGKYHSPSSSSNKSKKTGKAQLKDYLQTTRKRKVPLREPSTGYTYPYPGCENGSGKQDYVYPYSNNFGLDTDLYRSHSYQLLSGSLYSSDPYSRLSESEKLGSYSNGYYPYQHPLQYSNGYSDIVTPSPKYNYDASKYGTYDVCGYGDAYSKTKRMEDEFTSKYTTDYSPDKYNSTRLNASYGDSIRSSSIYSSTSYLNADSLVPSITPQHSSTSSTCSVFSGGKTTPTVDPVTVDVLMPTDKENNNKTDKVFPESGGNSSAQGTNHQTVIIHPKSKPAVQAVDLALQTSSSSVIQNGGTLSQSCTSAWTACSRLNSISKNHSQEPTISTSPKSDVQALVSSPASSLSCQSPVLSSLSNASPMTPTISTTVIQSTSCPSNGIEDKQHSPRVGSIAVPVVQSPSWHHKDWTMFTNDAYTQRAFTSDIFTKVGPWDAKLNTLSNPLLPFSEATHALIGE